MPVTAKERSAPTMIVHPFVSFVSQAAARLHMWMLGAMLIIACVLALAVSAHSLPMTGGHASAAPQLAYICAGSQLPC